MTIITILSIIAVVELARLFLVFKKTSKKGYFKQRLEAVRKLVWDLEFKLFKTREIREDVRREYASMKARIHSLEEQIKTWPPEKDEAEKKRVEDQKVLAERDATRFEGQMKQMDMEMEGAKPSAENHEGVVGITQQIESLKEVEKMLVDYLKHNC